MELRHAPVLTIAAMLRSAFGLALSLLAIRSIGAEAFGYFSLAWSFCAAFLFMFTGVNTILVASMVEARGDAREGEWMSAGLVASGLALVIALALASGAALFAPPSGHIRSVLVVCPLLVACQLVTLYCCAVMEGRGRMVRAALLPLTSNACVALVLGTELARGQPVPDLDHLLVLLLGAYAAESLLAVAACATQWRQTAAWSWSRLTLRKLMVGGLSTQAANLVSFLLDPWSKGVLALILGPASVAIFDLSMKVGWGLHAVFSAYSRLFLQIPPGAQDRRMASLHLAAELTWTPAALIAAIGLSVMPPLLSGWLRVDQSQLAMGMAMALATCMLMTAASAAYISLIGFQDHGFIFRNQLILGLSNVVAAPLLVPWAGFAGAFAGSLVGTLVNFELISRRLQHHMPAFKGLQQLAQPFAWRLVAGLATFALAGLASTNASGATASIVTTIAALALLSREPLAHATWRRLQGK